MRKLKKLTLNKEAIVNLNDLEMQQIQGGSTWPCVQSIIETISVVGGVAYGGYELTKENSWWNCNHTDQPNCMGDISNEILWVDGVAHCQLPEVYVNGIAY